MTIPKKIHYCWLSGEPIPKHLQKCMQTWQDKMPEYELVLWDKNKFDVNSVTFVREACAVRKWAFAADYIRAYALYTEGGIYLDTDVIVRKSFDDFLPNDFFTAIEYSSGAVKRYGKIGFGIQAAILGAQKGHPYLRDCLQWYEQQHFVLMDDRYNDKTIAPTIYAKIAEKYGFQYKNEIQFLKNNMVIFPSTVFSTNSIDVTKDVYAVHYCNASWQSKDWLRFFRRNKFIRKIFGLNLFRTLDDIINGNF
jgi:hypothetical protein